MKSINKSAGIMFISFYKETIKEWKKAMRKQYMQSSKIISDLERKIT